MSRLVSADVVAARPHYRGYVLGVLALSYALSFMDRQILSVLLEDIRAEFHFSDTELGLLSGTAFALFYSALGIPIARVADRSNRVTIISIAVALWSVMTVLCGACTGFVSLFAARMGVGVGEAGGAAPAHSILADYFDERALPRAMSIYGAGSAIGAIAGVLVGGSVAAHMGWRWAFIAAALPGLLIAPLLWFTVREPARAVHAGRRSRTSQASLRMGLRSLWSTPIYRSTVASHSLAMIISYASATWLPAFFVRSHGFGTQQATSYVLLIFVLGGLTGTLSGGMLTTWLVRYDRRWQAWLPMIGALLSAPLLAAGYLQVGGLGASVALLLAGNFTLQWNLAPSLALIQSSVVADQRAVAASVVFLAVAILGLGVGPALVGILSDLLAPDAGRNSLAWALCIGTLVGPMSAGFSFAASRKIHAHG